MNTRCIAALLSLALGLGWLAGTGFSEEGEAPNAGAPAAGADPMAAFFEAHKLGPHHKTLASFVGEFDVTGQLWHGPEPTPVTATASHKWVLDGRHIQTTYKGQMFGGDFEGHGHMGYDNVRELYWSTWVDNVTTGMSYKDGTCAEGGKVITMKGTFYGPAPMGNMETRMVWTIEGPDTFVLTSYATMPQVGEFKEMEIRYTRKK